MSVDRRARGRTKINMDEKNRPRPHINSADENCAILVMETSITIMIMAILKIQTVQFATNRGRTIGLMVGGGVNDKRRRR